MPPKKIKITKITKNEIPNVNLSDEVYETYYRRLAICGNRSRRDSIDSTSNESICEENSNNSINHSSTNLSTLVDGCEIESRKDSISNEETSNSTIPLVFQNHSQDTTASSNPANQKKLVIENISSQSQHQVINIITDDNNRSDN
ncbi:hypothetical protein F8M41_008921 [Gigaspora margarita]|uniref:Uncharacterized protein n=1 Tax=Gigaspora margarita TaxID=4874 RepID=A0A8H3X2Z9_GIGMA|nr:hypothetical protein F8M41_008921 [Gigaspora margarita]